MTTTYNFPTSSWTTPPQPRRNQAGNIVGRTVAILFAPLVLIMGGIPGVAFGAVGFVATATATGIGLAWLLGTTHDDNRAGFAAAYAIVVLAWGWFIVGGLWAALNSLTFGGSC